MLIKSADLIQADGSNKAMERARDPRPWAKWDDGK